MPQYFFHVVDQTTKPDTEGSQLSDIHAAHAAAVRLCGEMIRELDGKFWAAPLWQLRVTDHDQQLLFTLTFSGEQHHLVH